MTGGDRAMVEAMAAKLVELGLRVGPGALVEASADAAEILAVVRAHDARKAGLGVAAKRPA